MEKEEIRKLLEWVVSDALEDAMLQLPDKIEIDDESYLDYASSEASRAISEILVELFPNND